MKKVVYQFGAYLIVGGIAFWVDIGIFLLLVQTDIPMLAASASGFVTATLVNYYLSYKIAFVRGRFARHSEITRLFLVAFIGLVLNTSLVWLFAGPVGLAPPTGKVLAVPLVLVWNFLGRQFLVFQGDLPHGTQAATRYLSCRLRGEPARERDR